MRKESFKTVLLTILFILSIALTQKLWIRVPTISLFPFVRQATVAKNPEQFNPSTHISDIISPQSFTINFGGINHTVLFSDSHDIWETIRPIMRGYFENEVKVEEMTAEGFRGVSDIRAIIVNFDYSIPLSIVRSLVEGNEGGIQNKITSLDHILVPISQDDVIYISDKANKKYYKVHGKVAKHNVAQKINKIEEENITHETINHIPKYDYYYSVKSLFDVENDLLIPLDVSERVPKIKIEKEINATDVKQVDSLASTFFGENFDFVKKIIENDGTIIYMYDYGRKVLRVDPSGSMEYLEEPDEGKSQGNIDLAGSIHTATQFILSHDNKHGQQIVLKDAQSVSDKNNDQEEYQIFFTNIINDLPVYIQESEAQAPLEVKVTGNQVTRYKRQMVREKIDVSFLEDQKDAPVVVTPQEALSKNLEMLQTNLRITSTEGAFNEVLATVKDAELAYYDMHENEGNALVPVWRITFEEDVYFFDGYTGKILNRFKE